MPTQPSFSVEINGVEEFNESDGETIGLTIGRSGNKSAQSATVTISNHKGTRYPTAFPSRSEVKVRINGILTFTGFLQNKTVTSGSPGQIVLECAGRTILLKNMAVRPIIYNSEENRTSRDSEGVVVRCQNGKLELPTDPKHIPIFEILSIRDSSDVSITPQQVEYDDGIIFIDHKYDGQLITVNYTCFKEKYEAVAASTVMKDLVRRHAQPFISVSGVTSVATTITFEPNIDSDLFREVGRIRDTLGSSYDFFVDDTDILTLVQRSGTPVKRFDNQHFRSASFSVDDAGYANVVNARSPTTDTTVQLDAISQVEGVQQHQVEGLNPSGTQVDAVAQGFKAIENRLEAFQVKALRNTQSDILGWEIQYNGHKDPINHTFATLESTTPDSNNVRIDTGTTPESLHVQNAGTGNAYFSNEWQQDLTQDVTGNFDTSDGAYQSITVSDLTRTDIKGISFASNTASGEVEFEIRSGTGAGGTLLGTSETVDLADADHAIKPNWFPVHFAEVVDVSGETTISIVKNNVSGNPRWEHDNGADSYAGGVSSVGGSTDFAFQVFTVVPVEDILASVVNFTDDVTDANKTPKYYVSRNYEIGFGTRADWIEVLNNLPTLFQNEVGQEDKFGIKIEFQSNSTTADPLVTEMIGSVAYVDASAALESPSGITVGGLSGSIQASNLPSFDPERGSFTEEVSADADTHLEINGNYWLILYDGDQASSLAHFFVVYDDGAEATKRETWSDETNIGNSSNLTVDTELTQVSITPLKKSATMRSKSLGTTSATMTHAQIRSTENTRGGAILSMVSRNKRNYYYPGRSTDTTKRAVYTGEAAIYQFDDGDFYGDYARDVRDVSGNGFDISGTGFSNQNPQATGQFGDGYSSNGSRETRTGELARWLTGDISLSFYNKAGASSLGDKLLVNYASDPTVSLRLRTTAAGKLVYSHTYNHGASTETYTTSTTFLVEGSWKHIGVSRDRSLKKVIFYLDGVETESFQFTNQPDVVNTDNSFTFADDIPAQGDGLVSVWDEFRVWPSAVPGWLINHVRQYPYDAGPTKFAFPSESDSNDTYTDSQSASGDTTLRVFEYFAPAIYSEDRVRLWLPFDSVGGPAFDEDYSAYAHTVTNNGASIDTTNTGSGYGSSASFDGVNDFVSITHADSLATRDGLTLMGYIKQDVQNSFQTIIGKEDAYEVQLAATSASQSEIIITLKHANGQREHSATIALGTTMKHLTITYDVQILRVYLDGVQVTSRDFGSRLRTSDSRKNLFLGVRDVDGTKAAYFDGSIDEFFLLDYAASSNDIATLIADPHAAKRSPVQFSYTAAGYGTGGAKAYSDGKYLVSRDNEDTWTDDLDGTGSNANGSLAFKLIFGSRSVEKSVACVKKDQTEIDRLGYEVERTINVNTEDYEVLCSVADGFLAILKDGIAKGDIVIDGDTSLKVGDIVTINYPTKGQSETDIAVATVDHIISNGDFYTTLGLGEEERTLAALISGAEAGVGG